MWKLRSIRRNTSAISANAIWASTRLPNSISFQLSYFGEVRKGEDRVVGIGYVGRRLHVLCFIPTHNGIRVISFRKANDREARKHGKPKTIDAKAIDE